MLFTVVFWCSAVAEISCVAAVGAADIPDVVAEDGNHQQNTQPVSIAFHLTSHVVAVGCCCWWWLLLLLLLLLL